MSDICLGNEVVEEKITYRDAIKQKEYMKLLVANTISRFGDSIDAVAFTWLTYAVTGSAAWSALIYAMNMLPSVVLQPFMGAIVEGLDKKKVMVITDWIRGLVVLALAGLYLTDHINPLVLVLFTVINSTVETFCIPAASAIIPNLIDMKYYSRCSALSSTITTVVQLVGMAAAGALIGFLGVGAAIGIDAVTFILSGVMLCFLRSKEDAKKRREHIVKGYFTTLKEGFVYLKDKPVIRNFIVLAVLANGAIVPLNALQAPIVSEVWKQGPELLSYASIILLVSMGAGSLLFPMIMDKMKMRPIITLFGVLVGAGLLVYASGAFFSEQTWMIYVIATLGSAFCGMGAAVVSSAISVQFMKSVAPEYLARVGAIFNAGACAANPVVSGLISGISAFVATNILLVIGGVISVIIFLFVSILRVRVEE